MFHLSELVEYETNNSKERVASPKWSVFSPDHCGVLAWPRFGKSAHSWRGSVRNEGSLVRPLPWVLCLVFRLCFLAVWVMSPPRLLLCIVVRERFLDTAITLVVQHYVIARLSTEVDFVYGPVSFGLRWTFAGAPGVQLVNNFPVFTLKSGSQPNSLEVTCPLSANQELRVHVVQCGMGITYRPDQRIFWY